MLSLVFLSFDTIILVILIVNGAASGIPIFWGGYVIIVIIDHLLLSLLLLILWLSTLFVHGQWWGYSKNKKNKKNYHAVVAEEGIAVQHEMLDRYGSAHPLPSIGHELDALQGCDVLHDNAQRRHHVNYECVCVCVCVCVYVCTYIYVLYDLRLACLCYAMERAQIKRQTCLTGRLSGSRRCCLRSAQILTSIHCSGFFHSKYAGL